MLDWLDDMARMLPQLWLWKSYAVALWRTMRRPVKGRISVCRSPKTCRLEHRLMMVFKKGKPGYFVLVH
jgi:hypothetical protein